MCGEVSAVQGSLAHGANPVSRGGLWRRGRYWPERTENGGYAKSPIVTTFQTVLLYKILRFSVKTTDGWERSWEVSKAGRDAKPGLKRVVTTSDMRRPIAPILVKRCILSCTGVLSVVDCPFSELP